MPLPSFVRIKSALAENRRLAILSAAFLIVGGLYSILTPLFEAGDEIWHYPFVQHLASGNGLPVQDPARRDLWEQEGGQPPLYYALSAATTFWIDTRDLPDRLWRNPYAKIGIPLAYGNKNLIIHTGAEDFPWHDTALAVHLIRILSLLLSLCTVVLTYYIAKEILTDTARNLRTSDASVPAGLREGILSGVPIFAAALVAFNPMFLFVSASVNNDSLAVALASLALLLTLRLETRAIDRRRPILLGILCGFAALTKESDLALLPLGLGVAAWVAWRRYPSSRIFTRITRAAADFLAPGLSIAIPTLVIAGWWYLRNYILYGDLLGLNVWLKIAGGRQAPLTIAGLLGEAEGFRISFWGNFGGVNLIAPGWVYAALDLLTLLAFIGLVAAVLRRRFAARLWIPALWLAIVLTSLVRWTFLTYASQGRLIFPAISAVGVLMAFGLAFLWREIAGIGRMSNSRLIALHPLNIMTCVFLLGFAIGAPFLIISPAYSLPARLPSSAPTPNPVHISFAADGARPELAGYEVGRSVRGGEELPLTLYWRTSETVDRDLYVYVHVYDASGKAIGHWEALPGNGLYPARLWTKDELIVDQYKVPISTEVLGPQVGRVEVGLTPVGSTVPLLAYDPNGTSIVPTIGHFKIAASHNPAPELPALFRFEKEFEAVNIHFSGVRGGRMFEIDPAHPSDSPLFGGDLLRVALTLRAASPPDDDYVVFVHLVDAQGKIVLQQDAPPGGTSYPTSYWDNKEEVDDQVDLLIPDGITPGDYRVELGVYHSGGGPRLSVSGSALGQLQALGDHLELATLSIGK